MTGTLMINETGIQADIEATLVRPLEPMSDEELDLTCALLETEINKLNRICNLLLNRPNGLNIHALETLHHIKTDLSWLKWHVQTQRLPDASAQAR